MRLLGALLAAVLLAGCGSSGGEAKPKADPQPKALLVSGTLDISAAGNYVLADTGQAGSHCVGQNGMDDITEGAQITVTDSSGRTVGIGELGAGALTGRLFNPDTNCEFSFQVEDVKTDDDLLAIEISHRGKYQFKRENAVTLALKLGD